MLKAPQELTPDDRVIEIVSIMTQGILRLNARNMRKSKAESVIPLDSTGDKSVCVVEPKGARKTPCKPMP